MIKRTIALATRVLVAYGIVLLCHWLLVTTAGVDVLGILVAIPFLAVYLLSQIGIPGLLENNGLCGWGWCEPTVVGYLATVLFWLMVILVIAWVTGLVKAKRER